MTYCVGMLVDEGLAMIADTRTNAGLDSISAYRKLHVVERPGERVGAVATAGNLSVTQTALALVREVLLLTPDDAPQTLETAPSLFRCAQLVGQALRADMDASLSVTRRLTTKGSMALDADKLAPLLAALLPKKGALSGALALDWNLETALPGQASASEAPQSLLTRLRGLGFLNRAEAVLTL
mgnify:CR=1 FL=1